MGALFTASFLFAQRIPTEIRNIGIYHPRRVVKYYRDQYYTWYFPVTTPAQNC